MTKFVVRSMIENVPVYLKIQKGFAHWIANPQSANRYPSRYAARKHIRELIGIPESREIVALED